MNIKCPTCKRVGEWFASAYGPFCSKRCKLVDLGKWFAEEHLISSAAPEGGEESVPPEGLPKEAEPEDQV